MGRTCVCDSQDDVTENDTAVDPNNAATEGETRLKGNRDWFILWATTSVSALGSSITTFATPLVILYLTGSLQLVSVALTAATVAGLVTALLGGALIDRVDTRRLLMALDLARAAVSVGLIFAALGHIRQIYLWIVLLCVMSVASGLYGPASSAITRDIVHRGDRVKAAGLNQARSGAARLLGPTIGGSVLALAFAAPYLLDTLSFVVAAIGVYLLRVRVAHTPPNRDRSYVADVVAGLRFCWESPILRSINFFGVFVNLAITASLLLANLSLAHAGYGPRVIGLVDVAAGLATTVGSLMVSRVLKMFRSTSKAIFICSSIVLAGLVAQLGAGVDPVVLTPILCATMLPFPVLTAIIFGSIMNAVPRDFQGRVGSAGSFSSTALMPLSPVMAGVGLQYLGVTWVRVGVVILAATGFVSIVRRRALFDQ